VLEVDTDSLKQTKLTAINF